MMLTCQNNLSKQVTEEEINDEKNEIDMENLIEILSKIGDEKPFEFEFFTGGENKKFDDTMRSYGLVMPTTIIMVQANQFLIFF